MKDTGGMAYPTKINRDYSQTWDVEEGMTLRDYFAGQALTGILSNSSFEEWSIKYEKTHKMIDEKQWAWLAYETADAMIKERNKE